MQSQASDEKRRMQLDQLVETEGFDSLDELLEMAIGDSVSPAICLNDDCDYTTEMEPDLSRYRLSFRPWLDNDAYASPPRGSGC